MSKTFFFIPFLFIVLTLSSCSSESKKSEPKNMIANFQIEGMVCEHGCKGVIEKQMNKVKGITSFDIDFEKETAEVFFDQNIITSQAIITHVESINDGIYKMKLIKEYKQVNAKGSMSSSKNAPVSVSSTFSIQIPDITHFVLEWIKI
jgi:copper chaperone CopZ